MASGGKRHPDMPSTPWFVRCGRCAVGRTVRITPAEGRAYDAGRASYLCTRCVKHLEARRKRVEWQQSLFGDWYDGQKEDGGNE